MSLTVKDKEPTRYGILNAEEYVLTLAEVVVSCTDEERDDAVEEEVFCVDMDVWVLEDVLTVLSAALVFADVLVVCPAVEVVLFEDVVVVFSAVPVLEVFFCFVVVAAGAAEDLLEKADADVAEESDGMEERDVFSSAVEVDDVVSVRVSDVTEGVSGASGPSSCASRTRSFIIGGISACLEMSKPFPEVLVITGGTRADPATS